MSDTVRKLKNGFGKEKIKWIFVALMSVVLLVVVYKNWLVFKGTSGREPVPVQGAVTAAADDIQEAYRELKGLVPKTLQPVDDGPEPSFALIKRDLFSLSSAAIGSEENGGDENRRLQAEQGKIILKGTILNGPDSVAFFNDNSAGLGESYNGWQVVSIGGDTAILKKGQKEITITAGGESDGMY